MSEITMSIWGCAAMCGVWFLIGMCAGICIAERLGGGKEGDKE